LAAVPDVPFGFLNQAWEEFKESFSDGDELWEFSDYREEWGFEPYRVRRSGFSQVRGNEVLNHFIRSKDFSLGLTKKTS
jgi:hypothetical protein